MLLNFANETVLRKWVEEYVSAVLKSDLAIAFIWLLITCVAFAVCTFEHVAVGAGLGVALKDGLTPAAVNKSAQRNKEESLRFICSYSDWVPDGFILHKSLDSSE